MIGYTPTPDYYNDYLAHYGVMGMKWGVRKDLRKFGSISEKTKKKMKKAMSKASYRKTRRMLNGLEDMKSDYRSEYEEHKSKNKSGDAKRTKSNISKLENISKQWQNSAKKKNYKYGVNKDVTRYSRKTRRGNQLANTLGYGLLGPIGGVGASASYLAYASNAHKKYTDKTKGKTSAYVDTSGVYYTNQKKKNPRRHHQTEVTDRNADAGLHHIHSALTGQGVFML